MKMIAKSRNEKGGGCWARNQSDQPNLTHLFHVLSSHFYAVISSLAASLVSSPFFSSSELSLRSAVTSATALSSAFLSPEAAASSSFSSFSISLLAFSTFWNS